MSQAEPTVRNKDDQKLRALIVALAHNWVGLARMPNALARHGFDVSVIGPAGGLVTFATPLAHLITFKSQVNPEIFWKTVTDEIERFEPHILIPGDDLVVHLLHELHATLSQARDAGIAPPRELKACELLERSMGKPERYEQLERKSALVEMAANTYIPLPPSRLVGNEADLNEFVASVGYPVILKLDYGASGMGVLPCENEAELKQHYTRAVSWRPFKPGTQNAITAQKMIPGPTFTTNYFAWRGRMVTAFSTMRERTHPGRLGLVAISTPLDSRPMRALARRVIEYFGISGLGSVQMLQDPETGEPMVMEINPRPTPVTYMGEVYGADLIEAMRAILTKQKPPPRSAPRFAKMAIFQNESLRDPNSPELRDPSIYHDVPRDQPQLLAAILRVTNAPAVR